MARIYQEYLKKAEQEPISISELVLRVQNTIRILFKESDLEYFFGGLISLSEFACYLVFEAVAQDIREKLEKMRVYEYAKSFYANGVNIGDESFPDSDIHNLYRGVDRDVNLRKEFLTAAITRQRVPLDEEKLKWIHDIRDPSKIRYGYSFTKLQMEQLHDKDDFWIKKVHELRRFQNPKHAPNRDVKQYYESLTAHAQKSLNQSEAKDRVLAAINLNDFENHNLSFFLYHVAEYCIRNGKEKIDAAMETCLLTIASALSLGEGETSTKVFHKPVLFMRRFIPAAVDGCADEISRYAHLEFLGLCLRKSVLPEMLKEIQYSYEDVDAFVRAPDGFPNYNIFQVYDKPCWDEQGKMISLLRDLIKRLTVDPLSE